MIAKYNLLRARIASNRVGDVISTPGGRGVCVGAGKPSGGTVTEGVAAVAIAAAVLIVITVAVGVPAPTPVATVAAALG